MNRSEAREYISRLTLEEKLSLYGLLKDLEQRR